MLSHTLSRTSAIVASLLGLGLVLNAGLGFAQFSPPSNLGRPGNREGAATRGTCKIAAAANEPGLTALTPKSNVGLTTAANPTVFWYLPKNNYQLGEMILYKAVASDQVMLDKTTFLLNERPTLDSFTWANQTLLPDQDYRWVLSLICDPANPDPSQIIYVEGWIRRIEAPAPVSAALTNAQGLNRFQIYAQAGLWYDALKTLAKQPNSPQVQEQWSKLLAAESVQLTDLSSKIIPAATATTP